MIHWIQIVNLMIKSKCFVRMQAKSTTIVITITTLELVIKKINQILNILTNNSMGLIVLRIGGSDDLLLYNILKWIVSNYPYSLSSTITTNVPDGNIFKFKAWLPLFIKT